MPRGPLHPRRQARSSATGAAREELARLGHETTIDYLVAMCRLVLEKTRLLPHVNPGVLTSEDLRRLRAVSVSARDHARERLVRGSASGAGSTMARPTRSPRCGSQPCAGAARSGCRSPPGSSSGSGRRGASSIESLLAIRELHEHYGHVQEVIVQNFRAKPDTKMAGAPEPSLDDLLWTVAATRLVFGPKMSVQAPPNLSPGAESLHAARRGGDRRLGRGLAGHHRPREPRGAHGRRSPRSGPRPRRPASASSPRLPGLSALRPRTRHLARPRASGRAAPAPSTPRGYAREDRWVAGASPFAPPAGRSVPGRGARPRAAATWSTSRPAPPPASASGRTRSCASSRARGGDFDEVCDAADRLRREVCGEHGELRRHPQHQLHQRLLLPLPVLRVLQGQGKREPAGASPTTSTSTRSPGGCARRGSGGRPRSACRAASTPTTPATPTSSSAGR